MKIYIIIHIFYIIINLCCREAYTFSSLKKGSGLILQTRFKQFKLSNQNNPNNIIQDGTTTKNKGSNSNLIEYIIESIDQGKTDELTKKGFSVTKLSNENEDDFQYKLNDPDIQAEILGIEEIILFIND